MITHAFNHKKITKKKNNDYGDECGKEERKNITKVTDVINHRQTKQK